MSWIAEYDTQGREFPTCVHVTKTTGTMTHGVTYVPIEDGKAVRAENAKLRELFNETLIRLVAASEAAGGGFMDARYCELLESYGIEVDA